MIFVSTGDHITFCFNFMLLERSCWDFITSWVDVNSYELINKGLLIVRRFSGEGLELKCLVIHFSTGSIHESDTLLCLHHGPWGGIFVTKGEPARELIVGSILTRSVLTLARCAALRLVEPKPFLKFL